jgi:hypothetical protein
MINVLKKKFGESIFFKTKMKAIEVYNDKISKKIKSFNDNDRASIYKNWRAMSLS